MLRIQVFSAFPAFLMYSVLLGCGTPNPVVTPSPPTGSESCRNLGLDDQDSDGISDDMEGNRDTDNDGTPDKLDTDSDNDGRDDALEAGEHLCNEEPRDSDEDGIPDYRDMDSDDNGLGDQFEDNGDNDNNGVPNWRDPDDDNDGISDAIELGPDPTDPSDTDHDGIEDYHDTDSDDDGVPDSIEGIVDIDDDGLPDYRDSDSFGGAINNNCDGYDNDGNGSVDEDCYCSPGSSQECHPVSPDGPEETCQAGTQECVAGPEFNHWGECLDAIVCRWGEQEFSFGKDTVSRPVDIVMAVDQSGSMSEEIANVQANINRLASTIEETETDYHVIMLAQRGTGPYDICVPPPLGGPDCTDGPRFMHIDQLISSNDSLIQIQTHIETIESFMRPDALRVFIVVTDDNSFISADFFDNFLMDRMGYDDYIFDGIVGFHASCSTTASDGVVYQELADLTGGLIESICTADWGLAFERFALDMTISKLIYQLDEIPYDSLKVFFENAEGDLVEQRAGTWRHNEKNNTIILNPSYTPEDGTRIVVEYRVVI